MTYFKGKCGEDLVKSHKYNISTKDGSSLVQANNWGSVVRKGTVLVMSMIMERLLDEGEARAQRNACPHCHETDLGVMEDEGWLQW
jgi:cytochrome c